MGDLYMELLAVRLAASRIDGALEVCFAQSGGTRPSIMVHVASDEAVREFAARLGAGVAVERRVHREPNASHEWLIASCISHELMIVVMGPHRRCESDPEGMVLS